ncbi:hypothetical protein AB0L40_18465 [Patulibacter sp. NPDC049589]|uniref:hypothetical protein n=1 Tax=Patulibacter sp. NPDC049589 TaxID=3154731 RepID=UPI003446C945
MSDRDAHSSWSAYERVNKAVVDVFFSVDRTSQPVYLDLEDHAIRRIATGAGLDLGDPRGSLQATVARTLVLDRDGPIFQRHRTRLGQWRVRGRVGPPPILGVLALLSLVAESMHADDQFGSSAYYARFVSAIGGEPDEPALLNRVKAGHRRDVPTMWDVLNGWIRADPRRGTPTAFPFDHRAYIGPALTQALVREGDRAALRGLFSWARLVPGQEVAREDMVRMLREWLPTSRVSQSLKKLCRLGAAEQVADVALAELPSWDGGATTSTRAVGLRLVGKLLGRPGRPPGRRLQLALLARTAPGEAILDFGLADEMIELAPDEGQESIVRSSEAARALNAITTVMSDHDLVARTPRPLVVLRREGDRNRLLEVDRAILGESHVLLARDLLADRVADALPAIARPGWQREDAVSGLPAGWSLFSNVEIVAPGARNGALEALVPTGWSQLMLHGGFRLPGKSRWLASAPPQLAVNALQDAVLQLTGSMALRPAETDADIEIDVGDEQATAVVHQAEARDGDVLDLASRFHEPGRLYFVARGTRTTESVARTSCELVAPTATALAHDIGHQPDWDPRWAVSAVQHDGNLRGADVPSNIATAPPQPRPRIPHTLGDRPESGTNVERAEPPRAPELPVVAPECFITGFHHYRLPPGRNTRGISATCTYCERESFIPPPAPRGATSRRAVRMPARPTERLRPEEDLLLALSAEGHGNRRAFERIIEQVDDRPWAVGERSRTLSSLGHLDLSIEPSGEILQWGISPPMLVPCGSDELTLSGWRSLEVISAVRDLAGELEMTFIQTPNAEGPDRVSLRGPDRDTALELLDGTHVDGVVLRGATGAAERLAAALPHVSSLVDTLPSQRAPQNLERYSPFRGRWERCDRLATPGAHRTVGLPRRSFYFDGIALRSCETYLARWLDVPLRARQLAYGPTARALIVPRGCRLPGLWERAAMLSSGWSAQATRGGIAYRDVPPTIAERIASSLHATTEKIDVA